jgi:predicted nucleic acid-binding protein
LTLVVDASFVVAGLVDVGGPGAWAQPLLIAETLAAPHLMHVEVAHTLRRLTMTGALSAEEASLAHAVLLDLPVDLFPYAPYASRVWELRNNVTAYDAWYVALAEFLRANVATLDVRLARTTGLHCGFETPPTSGL